jgi:integrase
MFSDKTLQALPADGREHFDGSSGPAVKGLALRVSPKGLRTWCFHYSRLQPGRDDKPRSVRCRLDFGHYRSGKPSDLGLREARAQARTYRAAVDATPPIDPRSLKTDAQAARSGRPETVNELIAAYLGELRLRPEAKRLRSIYRIERMLARVGKAIGRVRLDEVTPFALKQLVIDPVRKDGSNHMAAAIHSRMHLMFKWAGDEQLIDDAYRLTTKRPEVDERKPNARPLNPDEVRTFWHGVADVFEPAYRDAVTRCLKLSLLSGCRIGEAAAMDMADVRDDVWTIPATRAKNSRAHLVPVNADMRAVIGDAKSGSPWGLVRGKPITGAIVSNMFCRRDVPKALGAPDYTAHSLRRTVATQLDEMGVLESTVALCLNHSEGESSRKHKTTRMYIQPSAAVLKARELAKLDLKRDAFDRWAERLRGIVG